MTTAKQSRWLNVYNDRKRSANHRADHIPRGRNRQDEKSVIKSNPIWLRQEANQGFNQPASAGIKQIIKELKCTTIKTTKLYMIVGIG